MRARAVNFGMPIVPRRTENDCGNVLRRPSRRICRSSDIKAKIETWIAARTFSPDAGLISMDSSQERAELEAKLARCRDLAREFREGPTADMIRDQFAKASKDWRTRQILLTAPMMLRRDPCRIMERATAARDEGTLTGVARVTALGFFQLTRRAAEQRENAEPL